MKKLVICSLAFLLLGTGCLAVPMKLDGSAGQAILEDMISTTENLTAAANQTINQTDLENETQGQENLDQAKDQAGGLWSWGGIPASYSLNESSGELQPVPTSKADWLVD